MFCKFLSSSAILAVSALGAGAANAQETGQDATVPQAASSQPDEGQSARIEDIIVTAQRRAESAQSVPISLQSFNSKALESAAVESTEELTNIVGGLMIQPTAARPMVFLRGIGSNSSNSTPAVTTFIDGVYQPFGNSTDLANISSVEILKGPQGTLFGRNSTGGVIQITTTPPSETRAARVEFGYGNYDTVDANAYITGGLATGVAMDLSLRYSDQGDGYGTNIFNGDDVFLAKKFAARSRLRAELSDVSTLTLAGDYSQVSGTVGTNINPAAGYGFLFVGGAIQRAGSPFFPNTYDINAGPITPYFKAKEWGASLSFETEFSDLTFRNITAYRRGEEHARIDPDGSPGPFANLSIDREPRTAFTQELQLLSNSSGPLTWVVGAFYYRSKAVMEPFRVNTNAAYAKDWTESIASYAQASYEILPSTKLTLGGRYTVETRKIDGFVQSNGVTIPALTGTLKLKYKEPTWRVALDHNINDNVLLYASTSRGFNGGFFNQSNLAGFANTTQNPEVQPEFLTAYEVGTKMDLLDRRLRVNVSAFLYDYKNVQQQIYSTTGTITVNAGDVRLKGIDFEFTAKPVRSLTLSLSGTYIHSRYTDYPAAPDYLLRPNGAISATSFIDASGNVALNTPEWS
ncbi:TonB-dependent receptor [Sphingobium phenoxybenzoativorans]|uniref:TonB-dependent receptor n=1 Tax=Sphingobium phenoxybenzoativorans TaxID=1592790 RepID=A0A975K7Y2_9SPHN|nr:TonB-dependent receptor [Sphingobium phenoxybenzoativorans]